MSWSAHLQHTATGLAIVFAGPVTRLDMTSDTAAHFASLLALEARHRLAGVVRALGGDRQDGAAACVSPEKLENKAVAVIGNLHPLCCDCDNCLNGDNKQ